jgi:hypothetical protein
VCAVCAAKLANRRAAEVQRGIDAWRAEGGDVLLVTVTMRHAIGDALAGELAALKAANRKLAQHRAWRREMVSEAGMVGRITSTEITRGVAGWHAHQHGLVFVRAGVDRAALQAALAPAWVASIKAAGFGAAVDVGLRVDGGHRAGAYVAKLGAGGDWSEADELVRAGSKRGRKGSATFWDLLDVAGDKGATEAQRSRARVLVTEYAEATHGLASLSWSPGLRARLDLEAAASDAELVNQQEGDAELVSLIDPADWQAVREVHAQPDVLAAANRGGQRAVDELLHQLRAIHQGRPPDARHGVPPG